MTIDEAIKDSKENDYNQVAEWLEELKFLRTTKETMFREIYNQALEDFSMKMKEVNLTNSFVLYYGDEIDLEEFMNLASEEIKEQLIK